MSLTTRMLAPIALIMSIALAFVAGSAYDNAKKIVSSNIVTIEATVVEAHQRTVVRLPADRHWHEDRQPCVPAHDPDTG